MIAAVIIIFMILSAANLFLKSDKSREEEPQTDSGHITLEDRLESLRELAGGLGPDSRFRRLHPEDLDLPEKVGRRAVVYEATDDTTRFLVLPTSYVITRSGQEASPLLKMVAVLDAENPEDNKVIFKFTVAPNLLPYHREYLHSAVRDYLKSHSDPGKREKAPNICLPTDISQDTKMIWENSLTHLDSFTTEGESIIIWVEANSIREAAAVARLLQPDPAHQGLHGKVRFPLDEEQTVQAPVLVNLDNTVGQAVSIEPDETEHSVSILNRAESPVQIENLMMFKTEATTPRIERITPPPTIEPGNRWSTSIPDDADHNKVLADYKVNVPRGKELSELRLDVGELELLLAVDTDIQPGETFRLESNRKKERLSAIRVMVNSDINAPESVTLVPGDENGREFSRKTIPFPVPLDRYLEPEKRTLEYSVQFIFENGTQLKSEKRKHNYSDTRLTIRRQILKNLVSNI